MFWDVLFAIGLAGLISLFIAYAAVTLIRLFVVKKPEENKGADEFDAQGRLAYTRTPYGYEFWYENGRLVRMRSKEGKEWKLNPVSDHLEPVTE